jgi:hypothetical protein
MDREESPIFVVGMPRSGTTLISAMLTAHPNIAISPETHFLSEWMRRYRCLDVRMERDFDKFWGKFSNSQFFRNLQLDAEDTRDQILSSGDHDYRDIFSAILRLYAEKKDKRRWGEKTPTHYAHIKQLLEWFPEARIIFTVRDPRAVVASRLNMSKKYPFSWWDSRTADDIAFQWQDSIDILDHWANDNRVYPVLYEKLVKETINELRKLCDFIGEEYSTSMMNYIEVANDLVSNEPWKDAVLKTITIDSVDNWRAQLSTDKVSVIEHFSRKGMNQYRYEKIAKPSGIFKIYFMNLLSKMRRLKRIFVKRPYHL